MRRDSLSRRAVLGSLDGSETASERAADTEVSRRGLIRRAVAGGLTGAGLYASTGSVAAAGRTELQSATGGGGHADPEGIDMAIYRAQTERTEAVELFFQKAQYLFDQLVADGIITGWRVRLYDTDRESVDNNKGEDWGAYDVNRIYADEGWTGEDLGLWFTGEAKVWNETTSTYERQSVRGGSAGYQTAFDQDNEIAPCWMSTANEDDRVVAHGASMETMHAMVDGDLPPVRECHGGHGEHSLGNAIYEYNEDYETQGYFGSPIAAGPHTWGNGPCASNVTEKAGVTFTLTRCTKRAVEYTKRDRLPGLSMCVDCGIPEMAPVANGRLPADHDGDGLYEDVRGTGDPTVFDVQTLFNNLDSTAVQNNAAGFDFSDTGGDVTVLDVQALFDTLSGDGR